MKQNKIACLAVSFLLALGARAESVSSATVRRAVNNWIAEKAQMDCAITGSVSSVRLCTASDGASFYVAKLSGGGFVVTSTQTEIDPIIAFSSAEDLVEDARNPLWALLVRDLAARRSAVASAASAGTASSSTKAAARSAASAASSLTPATRWARLVDEGAGASVNGLRASGAAVSRVSDVRVSPLLQTKWNQSTDTSGKKCYNYYTPNNYLCGCTATAGAQLLRYHKFPTAAVEPQTYTVQVNGEDVELTQMGGVYDWDNMPYVPGSKTTDAQRRAIGKLTYDVSLAVGSSYGRSETWGYFDYFMDLIQDWGYAHGSHEYLDEWSDEDEFKRLIVPSLDAKLPVALRICDSADIAAHLILADGYGYSSELLCVHLNFGWSGSSDAWYVMPSDYYTRGYSVVSDIYYNIYPHGPTSGAIASGRVLAEDAEKAMPGVVVRAQDDESGDVRYVTTDEKGIYAFILPDGDWKIMPVNAEADEDYWFSGYDSANEYELDFHVEGLTVAAGASREVPLAKGTLADTAFTSGNITLIDGALYLNYVLPAGGVYTFAVPRSFANAGGTFRVVRGGDDADAADDCVSYCEGETLTYCVVDLTDGDEDLSFDVCLVRSDGAATVPLYAGAGNYLPKGSKGNPIELDGDCAGVTWSCTTNATLLSGACWFTVRARPGITYDFAVAGLNGIRAWADAGTEASRLTLTVDEAGWVDICVSADVTTGTFTVSAVWTNEALADVQEFLGLPTATTSGEADWTVDGDAVRSGVLGNAATDEEPSTSGLRTVIAGRGNLSFDWKVSSEASYDLLSVYLDSELVGQVSGEQDWVTVVIPVADSATHTVDWVYAKDSSSSSGSDCGWIRNFSWTPMTFTAVFDANGGTCGTASLRLADGMAVGDGLPTPTREGYDFLGWYTAAAGGTRVSSATVMTADVMWYAHWGAIETVIVGATCSIDVGLTGYTAKDLPTGLKYDAKKGLVTGSVKKLSDTVTATFSKKGEDDVLVSFVLREENVPTLACEVLENATFVVGVQCGSPDLPLVIGAESGVKGVTASNLPTGLKLVSSKDKTTWSLSGVPTKAGAYDVAIVLTTAAGNKLTKNFTVAVTDMPLGATGTFNGFALKLGMTADEMFNAGALQVVVSTVGKITAKITSSSTYAFTATGWDAATDGVYSVTMTTAKGDVLALTCDSGAACDTRQMSGTFRAATGDLAAATLPVEAQRNAFGKQWFFAATGDDTNGWELHFAATSQGAALTVSLGADGKTSVAGKLGTNKITASGYADLSSIGKGAFVADFAPVVTVGKAKRVISLHMNLWLDMKDDHEEGVGTAVFVP